MIKEGARMAVKHAKFVVVEYYNNYTFRRGLCYKNKNTSFQLFDFFLIHSRFFQYSNFINSFTDWSSLNAFWNEKTDSYTT